MENKKSKLKGFTLIELIIVLAIFSGLMVLIMSFIDPVSRQMTDTSVRERTASYVDNISDYFDGSLRYAQFAKVYEKGICDDTLENIKYKNYNDMKIDGYDAAAGRDERWLAVRDFVDDYFDGAIKVQGTNTLVPITGKVHVLEILNDDTMIYDPTTTGYTINGKAGQVYETVYNFEAGNSIIKDTTEVIKIRTFDTSKNCYPSNVSISKNPVQVINSEHFANYSYYYQLGLFNLEPIPNSDLEVDPSTNQYKEATIEADGSVTVGAPLPIDSNANYYYSRLNPINLVSVSDPTKVKPSRFCMNVVAYETKGTTSNMFHVSPDGVSVIPVFRSPAYMSSSSMALINAIEASKDTGHANRYYRVKQKDETGELLGDDNLPIAPGGDPGIELISLKKGYYDLPFIQRTSNSVDHKNSSNIYIIYAVPSEIDDADITV